MELLQTVSKTRVQEHLERILQSSEFRNSLRMRRFLSFVVEAALDGTADSLKEQVIGVAVFDRDPSSFDPRTDPIVRNDARRLRRKLEVYYASEGQFDGLRIEIPKGGYAPAFIETGTVEPLPALPQLRKPFWGLRVKTAAAGLVLLCLLLAGLRLSFSRTPNQEAYQKYVLGRQILKEDYKPRSIPLLQQAIQLDPKFAEGYAGLGVAYSMAVSRHQLPREGNLAHAKELFQKALELDPNSAEAYSGLGALEAVMNADFFAAEHWFQRSLAARPKDAFTHFSYARLMLLPTGRLDRAASELTKAIASEPSNAETYLLLCRTHVYRRDWERAIAAGVTALQLSTENSDFSFEELAEAYAFAGRWDRFIALRNQYFTTGPDLLWTQLLQANGIGDRTQVRQISSQLLTGETNEFKRAILFSLRDDLPGVIASLQKANEMHPVETRMQARNSPYFDAFRSRPEFQALLRSMRLLS